MGIVVLMTYFSVYIPKNLVLMSLPLLDLRAEYDPKDDLLDEEFMLKGKWYQRKDLEVQLDTFECMTLLLSVERLLL